MPRGYIQQGAAVTNKLDALFVQLEQDILADITRQLTVAGKVTDLTDWQINRLNYLGNSSQDIQKMIQAVSGKSQSEMAKIYADAAADTYTRDKDLYTAAGKVQTPYADNLELQQLVRGLITQTNSSIDNITRSTGFMTRGANGLLQFTPISDIYNRYLDQNITGVLTGAFDYNTMIRKTVTELTASGLRSVDYASGRSYRIDTAVRTAILTGYGQVTSRVTFANAAQLGTELFEVAWHPAARPDHQLWQGKVYTRRQLETVCGYGTVSGLCGANCRHVFYPYIASISHRQWSDAELAALDAKENTPKTYKGKEYTDYQATQQQRKIEANIRAYAERVELYTESGADEEIITLIKAKLKALMQQYKDFSKAFKLPEQWERTGLAA